MSISIGGTLSKIFFLEKSKFFNFFLVFLFLRNGLNTIAIAFNDMLMPYLALIGHNLTVLGKKTGFCSIFLNPIRRENASVHHCEMQKAWQMFDTDGSNEIDATEFANFMNSEIVTGQLGGNKLDAELITKIFTALDQSGDGKVDFQEFMKIIHEREDGNLELRIKLN